MNHNTLTDKQLYDKVREYSNLKNEPPKHSFLKEWGMNFVSTATNSFSFSCFVDAEDEFRYSVVICATNELDKIVIYDSRKYEGSIKSPYCLGEKWKPVVELAIKELLTEIDELKAQKEREHEENVLKAISRLERKYSSILQDKIDGSEDV